MRCVCSLDAHPKGRISSAFRGSANRMDEVLGRWHLGRLRKRRSRPRERGNLSKMEDCGLPSANYPLKILGCRTMGESIVGYPILEGTTGIIKIQLLLVFPAAIVLILSFSRCSLHFISLLT